MHEATTERDANQEPSSHAALGLHTQFLASRHIHKSQARPSYPEMASSAQETGLRTPSSRTTTTWTHETPTVRTPAPPTEATPRSCAASEYTYTSYSCSDTARSGESFVSQAGGAGAGVGGSVARRQLLPDGDEDERGGTLLAPLMDATHSFLTVVDGAFAWLTEPRDAITRVPAPPRPERRVEALPRGATRNERKLLGWREVDELKAALSENSEVEKYMSLELNAKDVEAQALAQRGEAALHSKQELLRQLQDRIDAAPATREERLAGVRQKVKERTAELEEARRELGAAREAIGRAEQSAWEAAEEEAAQLAAEAARETAAAEAAEAEALASHGRLAERLARLEEAMKDAAYAPLAASRRARAALMRDEMVLRRTALPRFTHEPVRALKPRLDVMRAGSNFRLRSASLVAGSGVRGAEVAHVRLSEGRPMRLVVSVATAGGAAGRTHTLSWPMSACLRLGLGPSHPSNPMSNWELLDGLGAGAWPQPLPEGSPLGHLCLSLFCAPDDASSAAPTVIHLLASTTSELEDWYMGVQALSALPLSERISVARLRWRMLRLRLRHVGDSS